MNKNNEFVHTLRQYTILVVGSVLFSMGVTFFVVPWQLNTGGLIGIAQIISYTLIDGASLSGVINVLFNIWGSHFSLFLGN